MAETGAITPEQAADTDPKSVALAPEPHQNSVRYFTDWALPQLDMLIDETNAPLDVWTTLDLSMQRAADTAIKADVPKGAQGALVSIDRDGARSEEHTSELQSLMRISYAVFCLKKKTTKKGERPNTIQMNHYRTAREAS